MASRLLFLVSELEGVTDRMTTLETGPLADHRFTLREERESQGTNERFLIRPESAEQRARAIFEFENEIQVRTKSETVRPGMAELLLNAEKLIQVNEKSAASHLIRQALALDSRHPEALKKMIRCLGTQEWDLSQKRVIAKTLTTVEPTFENFAFYGQVLVDAKDLDGALEAFFEASMRVQEETSALFEVYKNMGNIYVRRGDFEAAEESYHKAFALQPDSDVLQVNLGTLAVQKEDWGFALEKFRHALELNPANDKAWVGLGLCHHQVGDDSLAQATLENALDICPSNRTAVHLMANWSLQARVADRAIIRLQDYLSTQEADIEMSLVLIHMFCHLQKFDLANLEIERALCWAPQREDLLQLKASLQNATQVEAS